ncbi:MAG: ABC transporter permease subunit [Anaerolineales bacterium]|nr:ABC transporter permease subunit [Anaerolineales bacterium]
MRNIWTIARREYQLYFISPVAYVVAFLFLLVLGWFFFQELTQAIQMSLYQPYTPGAQVVISPMVTLLLFTMPAITMRSIAEEQRMGTMELLLTAPVKDWELVVGKWLGGLLFVLTLLAITWIYPIVLNSLVDPGIDQGPLVSGYLGLVLMVSSLVALGVAISALFSNQIAAFFVSLAVVLAVWLIRPDASTTGGLGSQIVSYLNFIDHYLNFFRGTIDLSDVIYYLSMTSLGLFLGTMFVELRRWR